jgi:hypothetical protein
MNRATLHAQRLSRSAAVPGSVSPRGRQLQRLVGHRLVKPKTPFWIRRTFSASRSRESACPSSSPNVPPRHGRAAGHSTSASDREEEQRQPPLTGQPFNDGGGLRRGSMRSAPCRKGLGWPRTATTWTSARSSAARGPTTAYSREGSGTHHKPGQPSAIDPRNSSNSRPPYFKNAGWPQQARGRWGGRRSSGPASAQQNTQAQLRGFKTLKVEQHPP